ncbi:MAG TPA: outer membrane beta-barrel protein, partial [Aggregatilineaceae bacterium]|nr:outer membrane beta-barrel protein [Aggregatilineaceae bacterium]
KPQPDTRLGPALPEEIRPIGSFIPPNALTDWAAGQRLRLFGWANGDYTWSSSGDGLLAVEPRANRFGDQWLLSQAALVLERTLAPEWSWGFRTEFYMGADAALLRPVKYGFGPTDEKFGTDFRQAYFSLHAPVLTDEGVDAKFGRQYVPLGYETTMAPYRPMYSISYAWIYAQNGATTGATATVHVDPQLDVIAGVTLGVNALFGLRGRAPSYILRGLYSLDPDHRTKLVGTLYNRSTTDCVCGRSHRGEVADLGRVTGEPRGEPSADSGVGDKPRMADTGSGE